MKKVLSVLVAVLMVFTIIPVIASAASYDHIVSDGESFDISTAADGDTIGVSGAVTITGAKNVAIYCSEGTTLTLDNVTIDNTLNSNYPGVEFTGTGNVLIVKNTVTLTGGDGRAAVQVNDSAALKIIDGGSGVLTATGGDFAAGIGSGTVDPFDVLDGGSSITILGGTVIASGGFEGGAGIGGNSGTENGMITISGGTVTATGGKNAAGIGSYGDSYSCWDIKLSGGVIEAFGGFYAAGIGGGFKGIAGNITIEGTADVTAKGIGGAGIGGGCYGDGGTITITGGTVDATGGYAFVIDEDCGPAGIGGGIGGNGGAITISGGIVTAQSEVYGAGIGSGDGYPQEEGSAPPLSGGIITILGGTVNANGGYCGAGIGGGYFSNSGAITISGGTVNAIGGESAAGIGGGVLGDGNMISIVGGTVNAVSEGYGAGIGGGEEGYGGIINILGGTVYALSEEPPEITEPFVNNGENEHDSEQFISQLEILEYVAAAGIGDGATGVEPVINGFVTNRSANSEITISGGLVYAGGPVGDIGPGALILISGGSAVFLKNDLVNEDPPFVPDGHVHKTSSESKDPLVFNDNSVYGIKVASEWTDATGGYFRLYTLEYDANGGSGGFETIVAGGQEITLDDGTGLANSGYLFAGWNTQSDNEGTGYNGGGKMLMPLEDKTLYAVWEEDTGGQRGIIGTVLTDENGNPLPGYTIELHSVVLTGITDADGKVTFSNVSFEDHTLIIKNSSDVVVATFTLKMSEGSSSGYVINGSEIDVTYTGHTVSIELDISFDGEEATVDDVTILDNPDTGGNYEWLIWAAIASVLTIIAAMFALRRRERNNKY